MLTTDDAVEAMARGIQKRAAALDPDVTWEEWVPEARAALAALAKVAGVNAHVMGDAAANIHRKVWQASDPSGFAGIAALLRVLAEAAGEGR